jgi:3-oxoadipate enol-lactonase
VVNSRRIPINCPVHSPCLELNYLEQGSGEVLILVHGLGGTADNWRGQMEALAPYCRVIAPDLRGHGQSGYRADEPVSVRVFADDVMALLDQLGVARAHFCGLSMGGMIVLEIFVRHPFRLNSLILADTTAFFPPPQALAAILKHFDHLDLARWGQVMASLLLRRQAPAALRQEVARMLAANRPDLYRQGLIAAFEGDYRWMLSQIDLPTLVLVGEEDQATPIGYARLLHEHIKNSTLQIIPDAGHYSSLENPAAFNRQLVRHLQECQAGPRTSHLAGRQERSRT